MDPELHNIITALIQVGAIFIAWIAGYVMRGMEDDRANKRKINKETPQRRLTGKEDTLVRKRHRRRR